MECFEKCVAQRLTLLKNKRNFQGDLTYFVLIAFSQFYQFDFDLVWCLMAYQTLWVLFYQI